MKNGLLFKLIGLSLSAVFMYSCSDEEINVENGVISRNYASRAPINGKLYNNWENIDKIFLNGANGNFTYSPWVNLDGININIPDDFRMDIRKDDNWKLIFHSINDSQTDEPNYMFFYNKKTGILKVFYYSTVLENNQNLIWVLEAEKPTKLLQSNTLEQSYEKQKYTTTTNLTIQDKLTDIGNLNPGWNSFYFELPFDNENLDEVIKMSIKAYNTNELSLKAKGKFSGVVNIPKEVKKESGFFKIIEKLVNIMGKANNIFGTLISDSELGTLTDNTSKIFKSISSFSNPKTKTVNVQGTLSGSVELTGEIDQVVSGLVKSINSVPFKINKDTMGLWNLRKPTLYYSNMCIFKFPDDLYLSGNCEVYHKISCDENDESGILNSKVNTKNLKSYIIINPAIKNELESYDIISAKLFSINRGFGIDYVGQLGDDSRENIYHTNYEYDPYKGVFIMNYEKPLLFQAFNKLDIDGLYNYCKSNMQKEHFKSFLCNYCVGTYMPVMYRSSGSFEASMNIVVQFKYKDGNYYTSSRNYPVTLKFNRYGDSNALIEELQRRNYPITYNQFIEPIYLQDIIMQ